MFFENELRAFQSGAFNEKSTSIVFLWNGLLMLRRICMNLHHKNQLKLLKFVVGENSFRMSFELDDSSRLTAAMQQNVQGNKLWQAIRN